jgi:hypothetical protein
MKLVVSFRFYGPAVRLTVHGQSDHYRGSRRKKASLLYQDSVSNRNSSFQEELHKELERKHGDENGAMFVWSILGCHHDCQTISLDGMDF